MAALYLLSYIRKVARPIPASTETALRQLVKERPPSLAARPAPLREPVELTKEKGPEPFGFRASV
jgi:hypothetical protein